MKINLDKDKRWGIIGTIVFHLVVLLLMFMISMKPPSPPRPLIGLEVNLGNSDQGMGDIQPEIASQAIQQSQSSASERNEKVSTQDIEESVNLKNKDRKANNQQKEPEKPKVDDKYLFSKNKNTKNGGSEGITGKPGDQGNPNGVPNSDNYVGSGGDGNVAWNLAGRKSLSLPKPKTNISEQGTVVVKIWVDKTGKVINAKIFITGTTTSNSTLQDLAVKAAYQAIFNSNPNAAEVQTGTITYQFIL
jgi:TonB family protein